MTKAVSGQFVCTLLDDVLEEQGFDTREEAEAWALKQDLHPGDYIHLLDDTHEAWIHDDDSIAWEES